jgi:hypothetical protein
MADIIAERLKKLVGSGFLSQKDADRFEWLDKVMTGQATAKENEWLSSFYRNEEYRKLLKKVLQAMVDADEPKAKEKLLAYHQEFGTMGPAVFLTPWELTLADLDSKFPN